MFFADAFSTAVATAIDWDLPLALLPLVITNQMASLSGLEPNAWAAQPGSNPRTFLDTCIGRPPLTTTNALSPGVLPVWLSPSHRPRR